MSLIVLGWDVQWFTDSSRLRNQRHLHPLPPPYHLELLQDLIWGVLAALHSGMMSSPKPVIGWQTANWDSIISKACDWLCSHAWPCLICTYTSVSKDPNRIITCVESKQWYQLIGLTGAVNWNHHALLTSSITMSFREVRLGYLGLWFLIGSYLCLCQSHILLA